MRRSARYGRNWVSKAYVIDTCVIVRWYAEQDGFEHARQVRDGFLAGTIRLEAPDICRWELGNVLRKISARHGLTEQQVVQSVSAIDGLGVVVHPTSVADLTIATRLAVRHSLSLFDAAFVSLALRTGLPLLTTDARLVRAVSGMVPTELLRGVSA
jgi:predicted nucleic acid-binding protein